MKKRSTLLLMLVFCLILSTCNKQVVPQPDITPVSDEVTVYNLDEKRTYSVLKPTDQEIKDALNRSEYMMYGGKKCLVLESYILMDLETGEVIDLRHLDIMRHNDERPR